MNNKKLQQQLKSFSSYELNFDDLLELKSDFEELFKLAKSYRKHSVTLLINGYNYIKSAKKGIDNLVNYRITDSKLGLHVTNAIKKLNLLFHHLSETGREYEHHDRELRCQLTRLLEKLGRLLPEDYGVQLGLFDDRSYEAAPKLKAINTFQQWKRRQARLNYQHGFACQPKLRIEQLSLPLWQPPFPTQAQNINLRQARKLAASMGLPQKVRGKDLALNAFLDSFQQLWFYSSRHVRQQFGRSLLHFSI